MGKTITDMSEEKLAQWVYCRKFEGPQILK